MTSPLIVFAAAELDDHGTPSWHPEHKVCRYDTAKSTTAQGEAWVAGHWQCTQYTVVAEQSECTNWDWAAGHWVTTFAETQQQ